MDYDTAYQRALWLIENGHSDKPAAELAEELINADRDATNIHLP